MISAISNSAASTASEIRPVIRPRRRRALPDPATMTEASGDYGIVENSGPYTGLTSEEAEREMAARAERERLRQSRDHLPHQGLGRFPPALLGHADSRDPLPDRRRRSGSGRSAARPAAAADPNHRQGPFAARRSPRVRERDLPEMRRSGAPRDRHDGYLCRFELVLLSLLRSEEFHRRRSIKRRSTTGFRSISTSAAWNTRSCI